MNPQLCKFILRLFGFMLLAACAPPSIPNTPTSTPVTAAPALPTLAPTAVALPTNSVLPTVSFGNPVTATPTKAVESPFEFVATLGEILPSTDDRAYFRTASDGSVWMITNRGIARLNDSGWTVYLSNYEGYFVGIDTLGRAWFINPTSVAPTAGGATHSSLDSISAWDGTKWTKYSSESGWTAFSIDPPGGFSMAELHGQIWVSTLMDLRVFDGSRWKVIKPEEIGLQSPLSLIVNSFAGADEIWVTGCYFNTSQPHGSDIVWYDGSTWQSKVTPEEGGCLSTMPVEHQGHVWMASHDSLWGFARATKEWTHYALNQPPSSHIISLAFNESGGPWFISLACDSQRGCTETALYHLQKDVWIPVSPPNPGISFSSLLMDSANQIWVSARDGIYQIVNDQPNLVSHLIVSTWTRDRTGKIWVLGSDPSIVNKVSLWVKHP